MSPPGGETAHQGSGNPVEPPQRRKRRSMCPNTHCSDYGVETGLMGGCVCGSALVPFKTVDEQINETLHDILADSLKRMGFWR